VMKCLEPIWTTKRVTAERVRGRIERILDWARVRGFRSGENSARWRGHLDHLLPKTSKTKAKKHHPALSYAELPAFMAKLREQDSTAARALEFTILTAARSGEVLKARTDEINLGDKVWIVPPDHSKTGIEHRIPLSVRALELSNCPGSALFPGRHPDKAIGKMAMRDLLERLGHDDVTVHGFRSAFRDWCGDHTAFAREVAEAALGHRVGNEVERAYRRGDELDKRRKLMEAWATYCASPPAESSDTVVSLRSA
jgi:integrase